MWELLKVAWDVFILRDAAQREKLNRRRTGFDHAHGDVASNSN